MSSLELKDLLWVGAIAVGHAFQLGHAATEVAVLRRKYKINPPTMDGPPDFLRAVRAHASCSVGRVYLYARHRYIKGYIEEAEKRVGPFWMSVRALQGLSALSIAGLIHAGLREYAGVNIVAMARERIF